MLLVYFKKKNLSFFCLLTELDIRRNSRDQTHTEKLRFGELFHRVRSAQHSTFCWAYAR